MLEKKLKFSKNHGFHCMVARVKCKGAWKSCFPSVSYIVLDVDQLVGRNDGPLEQ